MQKVIRFLLFFMMAVHRLTLIAIIEHPFLMMDEFVLREKLKSKNKKAAVISKTTAALF